MGEARRVSVYTPAHTLTHTYIHMSAYQLLNSGTSIRCMKCHHVSSSARDVQMRYCPRCRRYHNDPVDSTPYQTSPIDSSSFNSYLTNATVDVTPTPEVCRPEPSPSYFSSDSCGSDSSSSSIDW